MKSDDFLNALKKEAKAQAKIGESHLLPASFNTLTTFFWSHTWQILTVLSITLAIIVLYFSDIQPL